MKKIKLALLTVALAGSTLAMAQDKSALIKQFIDLQKPGIESLARGLVEQSSAPATMACTIGAVPWNCVNSIL